MLERTNAFVACRHRTAINISRQLGQNWQLWAGQPT